MSERELFEVGGDVIGCGIERVESSTELGLVSTAGQLGLEHEIGLVELLHICQVDFVLRQRSLTLAVTHIIMEWGGVGEWGSGGEWIGGSGSLFGSQLVQHGSHPAYFPRVNQPLLSLLLLRLYFLYQ